MTLSKWQALGNDYLLVEPAELTEPLTPDRVRRLCDYHYGVGSDGLLRVVERELEALVRPDGQVELDVGQVEVGKTETLDLGDERVEFTPVSVGNPHAVVRREPERGELRRLGPRIERHSRFPERTNVQLVRVDGPHDLTVGVWERGAGETLSSGTSSVSAAAAAVVNGWCESPVHVHLPGGDLLVELDGDGRARLTGPVEEICRIELV